MTSSSLPALNNAIKGEQSESIGDGCDCVKVEDCDGDIFNGTKVDDSLVDFSCSCSVLSDGLLTDLVFKHLVLTTWVFLRKYHIAREQVIIRTRIVNIVKYFLVLDRFFERP